MSKVIPFPLEKGIETPEDFVQDFLHKIRSGVVTPRKIAIAMECEEGYVMTGYFDCDVADKQNLASHIQVDIMWEVVKSNIEIL